MCITVKVNVYRLGKTWRVRSGQGTWTRPDPTRQGLDPTRPAVLVHIPDPTRPNPTRPAGRPDPGTTLRPTEIMVDLVKVMTSYYYAQAKVLIARTIINVKRRKCLRNVLKGSKDSPLVDILFDESAECDND